jgi:phosphoribosylformimino-5-aminoimidazole carboxamide ribotide isomerase
MRILPAIDLRGGKCVRLRQGDYRQETIFGDDPAAMAEHWQSEGADFLHLVDLDGARDGRPANLPSVHAILGRISIPCQLGGGVRDEATLAELLGAGLERVVVGTRALEDPSWLADVSRRFPDRLALGVDGRDGLVALRGWEQTSDVAIEDLLDRVRGLPLAAVIYTDIGRDGMLTGPNVAAIESVLAATELPVIASGGIGSVQDVARLSRLPLEGCIIGRALYEGTVTLPQAIEAAAKGARPASAD